MTQYYSQAEQDKWVCEILDFKKDGYFVEIGAYDGIESSNTYFVEKELGWEGICIEPAPHIFDKLAANRKSTNLKVAVMDYKGTIYFGEDTVSETPNRHLVDCDTLDNILTANNAPRDIDYMSVDIEGCEYRALKDFPFDKWNVTLLTVEHNSYRDGNEKKNQLFELLTNRGFLRIVDDAKDPRGLPFEDWYVNKSFLDKIPLIV